MIEMILYAIMLGVSLSLILIGPAFFLLIETSLTKGWRSAIALDAGVIVADLICIAFAFFGSKDLIHYIETHRSLYIIGGFIIMIYGCYMFVSKPTLHINNEALVNKNYIKTFFNGFLMNILNIGIVIFWFVVVGWVILNYKKSYEIALFMGVALSVFFCIDLAKIFLARKFQRKMSDELVYKIRKALGVVLAIFGLVILLKGFISFDPADHIFFKKSQNMHNINTTSDENP